MHWIIYKTTNLQNGKIYIGQHKVTDKNKNHIYLGSGKFIKLAIAKYGNDSFKQEILSTANTKHDANILETHFIDLYDSTNRSTGYNITRHATGGFISEEAKQKISIKLLGRCLSQETKTKISSYQKGKKKTQEHIDKIKESQKDKHWFTNTVTGEAKLSTDDLSQSVNWMRGRPEIHFVNTHSPESNKKRSDTQKGKLVSVETRNKLRLAAIKQHALKTIE